MEQFEQPLFLFRADGDDLDAEFVRVGPADDGRIHHNRRRSQWGLDDELVLLADHDGDLADDSAAAGREIENRSVALMLGRLLPRADDGRKREQPSGGRRHAPVLAELDKAPSLRIRVGHSVILTMSPSATKRFPFFCFPNVLAKGRQSACWRALV